MSLDGVRDGFLLCEICAPIDFSSYFQPPRPNEKGIKNAVNTELFKEIVLGPLNHIQTRAPTCSFCRLLSEATHDVNFGDDASVTMWSVFCGEDASSKVDDSPAVYYLRFGVRSSTTTTTHHVQLLADTTRTPLERSSYLARVPREMFDMKQARQWLDICLQDHGPLCNVLGGSADGEAASPEPEDLLAIDLHDMRICHMPYGSNYLALSYCWPAKKYLTLLEENRAALFQSQALLTRMQELPGTVRDAIECAKEFPYRYLWIDALCIVQDDPDHKMIQLRQMDRVYSSAVLTLVSAYEVPGGAEDPCSGLPGFQDNPAGRHRVVENVQGLRMMALPQGIDDYLLFTRWYTRCWTFQEHQLSRRLLYFTPIQVCFQCSCSIFCEDIVCESLDKTAKIAPWNPLCNKRSTLGTRDMGWGEWSLSRTPIKSLLAMNYQFYNAIGYYTHRDISFPSDMLNAFEGVKAVLSEALQTGFWQGLPEKLLPSVLTFQLKGQARFRRWWRTGQPPSKPLFPSWTWAGWDSHIDTDSYVRARVTRTDAEFYIVNSEQTATRLNVLPDHVGKQSQRPSNAVIKAFLPKLVPREEVDASLEIWRNARTLACWTTHAFFILDGTHHSLGASNPSHERIWPTSTNYAIKNAFGETAGCILLPKDYFEQYGVGRMRCEFIAISRSIVVENIGNQYSYWDEDIYEMKDYCHLNVMMITRPSHLGEYGAYRAGVGVIHQDAWTEARPETDFVKLV